LNNHIFPSVRANFKSVSSHSWYFGLYIAVKISFFVFVFWYVVIQVW